MTFANGQTDDKDEKPQKPSQSTFIYLIIKLRDVKEPNKKKKRVPKRVGDVNPGGVVNLFLGWVIYEILMQGYPVGV